jgi:hypothetical protein
MKGARMFIYLGWQDRGNFGDDLLAEAWRAALKLDLKDTAPLYRPEVIKAIPSLVRWRLATVRMEKVLLLGGGTTLGFSNWARHISHAKALLGIRHVFSAGAGSAEGSDVYATDIQAQDWRPWRELRGLVLAGVRGPLTEKEVATHWCPTEVVGDPALMYSKVRPFNADRAESRTLGICLGSHTSTRFDVDAVAQAIRICARTLALEPVVFQLADTDSEVSLTLSSKLGNARIERYEGDVAAMMKCISSTSFFVSERLHGIVASTSLGVPSTPLAYASKCDDFWLSISPDRPAIKPTSSVGQIVDAILASNRPDMLTAIAARVDILQRKLLNVAAALTDWHDGRKKWSALA